MPAAQWHTLASFGLLLGALSLVEPKWALGMVGVAAAVVTVRNADKIAAFIN